MNHALHSRIRTWMAAPPRWVEYAYYLLLVYGLLGSVWGIGVSGLAGGGITLLAGYCILRLGFESLAVYRPAGAAILCGVSFIAVQLVVHGESAQDLRPLVVWIATLVLVQALATRPGFLGRFAVVAWFVGLSVLPYLRYMDAGPGVERARLDSTLSLGGLGNSNDLAAWFGFCGVYFLIVGIETARTGVRLAAWSASLVSLFMVALTVSRGSLIGFALAAAVVSPRLMRRSPLPAACLLVAAMGVYLTGMFQTATEMYMARGAEETGRLLVWPVAFMRFVSHPLTGVGMSNVITTASSGHDITPHNSFLYVAVASGIVPLLCFLGYWFGAVKSVRRHRSDGPEAAYRLPLLLYAFVQAMLGNVPFMSAWMIVVLAVVRLPTPGWSTAWTRRQRVVPLPVARFRMPARADLSRTRA